MTEALSASATFQALVARVAAVETGKAALGGAAFTGTVTFGDSNFAVSFNGGTQPFLAFDNGDNLSFIRSTNTFRFSLANSAQMDLTPSGLFVANILQVGDINLGLNLNGGTTPYLAFDNMDYLQFNRTTNIYSFGIGGATKFSVSGTVINIPLAQLATYADNAAATTGGLSAGDLYRTSTGQLMVRY